MPIQTIIKRDGTFVPFQKERIFNALQQAFLATKSPHSKETLLRLTDQVTDAVNRRYHARTIPAVEEIQDIIEQTLMEEHFGDVAKAYILYRHQHERLREGKALVLDIEKTMDGYLNQSDWRVNENSSINYSVGGLILHNAGAITANYWLHRVYDKKIADAHKNGDFHLHDLSMFSGYCAGWSLRQLLEEGFGGVRGKINSKPAKHFSTAIWHIINFLGTMQNEWAGAQALSSFDTYLAPFVKNDGLSFDEVKQHIQSFVFSVNTPSRWGTQPPFTNITLDWVCPNDLADKKAVIGGKESDLCYKDCQAEIDLINRAFLEVMLEGDADGRGFAYPIPTYNITKDFNWDGENADLLFQMTAKYGTPYFQNFVNSDLNPSDVRSMCCRLQLDKRELRRRGGGLFGADEFTGSIGVVTLNMPRIGYLSRNKEDFYRRLDDLMELAKDSLECKRRTIEKLMEQGLFPYTKHYLKHFNNHFSTIGLVGMHECCLNFLHQSIATPEGHAFTEEVLMHMREKLKDFQEKTGNLYNLEATPAEGTSYRLAKIDKEKFPNMIQSGTVDPYYTNSSNLPVDYTADVFEALKQQESLQTKYTGGTVFHVFLGESLPDAKSCRTLVRQIVENFRIPYVSISPTFSVCENHGRLAGRQDFCPKCGTEMEVYSRITGYYRAVTFWNKGKKEEFKQRVTYDVAHSVPPGECAPFACGCGGHEQGSCNAEASEGKTSKCACGTSDGACGNDACGKASSEGMLFSEDAVKGNENALNTAEKPSDVLFFHSDTCIKCQAMKPYLVEQHFAGTCVNTSEEAGLDLARKYNVRNLPALVLVGKHTEVIYDTDKMKERIRMAS